MKPKTKPKPKSKTTTKTKILNQTRPNQNIPHLENQVLEMGESRSPAVNASRAIVHRGRQDSVAQAAEPRVGNPAHVAWGPFRITKISRAMAPAERAEGGYYT